MSFNYKCFSNIVFVCLLTAGYILFFVANIWEKQWEIAGDDRSIFLATLVFNIAFSFVQIFIFFFALTLHRYLLAFILPPLFVASSLYSYMVETFSVPVNDKTIAVIFEATYDEIAQFINYDLILSAFVVIIASLLVVAYFWRCVTLSEREYDAAKVFAVITLFLILTLGGVISVNYPPYSIFTSSVNYAWERFTKKISANKPEGYSYLDKSSEPVKIILIVGESARADHFSLNGYKRETNFYTSKQQNLLNFTQVIACGALTFIAVPCIITDNAGNGQEISLISVFNYLGFYTAWLGAQGAFSTNDPISYFVSEAQYSILLEKKKMLDNSVMDGELLPLLENTLKNANGRNLFTVMHLYGSHWQYQARYPKEFEKFTPVCKKTYSRQFVASTQIEEMKYCIGNDNQSLLNSYDNSIAYTDYIIEQVIKLVDNENAVVVYISDHAESLGEEGRYLHGNSDAFEQLHVPMLWWASDKFIAAHRDEWKNITKKTNQKFQQKEFFYNLLGCVNIKSSKIDTSETICGNI